MTLLPNKRNVQTVNRAPTATNALALDGMESPTQTHINNNMQ